MSDNTKSENELIAEFMGLPLTKQEPEFTGHRKMKTVPFQRWKYDTSWDWLMPVVEKIEGLYGWNFSMLQDGESVIFDNNYKYQAHGKRFAFRGDRLQSTYKAVVKFIKWHNQQKP